MEPQADRWRITPTAEGARVSYRDGRWRTFTESRGDVAFETGGKPNYCAVVLPDALPGGRRAWCDFPLTPSVPVVTPIPGAPP